MAMYTNVSQRLIHAPDGTMMVPGAPVDLHDDCSGHRGIQDLVDSGDLVAGEVAQEDLSKVREEQQTRREERQEHQEARQEGYNPRREA